MTSRFSDWKRTGIGIIATNTMDKQQVRKEIRKKKALLNATRKQVASDRLYALLSASSCYQAASCVMLYASLPDEVPTLPLLLEESRRRHFVLPRVIGLDEMELCQYTGPDDLYPGAFQIPEPRGAVFNNYYDIDLILVPGMAFDSSGNRLGRGKGYYDRFLQHPAFADIPKWGVCYDFQLLEHIPAEPHDVRVQRVLCC